jgi:hypothetical protein
VGNRDRPKTQRKGELLGGFMQGWEEISTPIILDDLDEEFNECQHEHVTDNICDDCGAIMEPEVEK